MHPVMDSERKTYCNLMESTVTGSPKKTILQITGMEKYMQKMSQIQGDEVFTLFLDGFGKQNIY